MEIGAAIVGAVSTTVLPLVVSAFKAQFKKPLPCKHHVEELKGELELMLSKLKDFDESWCGEVISHEQENLVEKLRTLAHAIEDTTETFLRQFMSDGGVEKPETTRNFEQGIQRHLKEAKLWIQRFADATEKKGGSSSLLAAGPPDEAADKIFCDPPKGMKEPIEELKKLLVASSSGGGEPERRKLKVVSIVGFGGLGKTLLSSHVYKYYTETNNGEFDGRAFIRADGKDKNQLLKEILNNVEVKEPNSSYLGRLWRNYNGAHNENEKISDGTTSEVDQLTQQLQRILQDKRYFFVIIDMRKKDQWTGIVRAFGGRSKPGSRIMVTTTKLPVAKACTDVGGYVYKMRPLSGDFPRQIFVHREIEEEGGDSRVSKNEPAIKSLQRSTALSSNLRRDDAVASNRLQDESPSKMLKKCGGVPLAVICLAETCKGEQDNETRCKEALVQMCAARAANSNTCMGNSPGERMRRMLLSSYQELPTYFDKVCLLYLCMFPAEDDNVKRNSVIRRMMAEGLAESGDGNAAEKLTADEMEKLIAGNLERLVEHCVTQPVGVSSNGKTKRCKVHGIVHEFITRLSRDQGFITVCDETSNPPSENARRLSLHPNSQQWELPVHPMHAYHKQQKMEGEESIPKVRTLAVFSDRDNDTTLANKEAIATYKLMKVLDLEGCSGLDDSDLKSISCNLLLLKYLSLGGKSITTVPTEIHRLQLLETLDLRKTNVCEVPLQVVQLPELKNLLGQFQLAAEEHYIFGQEKVAESSKQATWRFDRPFHKKGGNKKKQQQQQQPPVSLPDSKLEILSGFVMGSSQGFPQLLIDMTKLRKVKVWCDSTASEKNLQDLAKGIQKFLRPKPSSDKDRSLSIGITKKDTSDFSITTKKVDIFLDHLHAATLPAHNQHANRPSLYSFKLRCNVSGFPRFLQNLASITELCLYETALTSQQLQIGLNSLPKSTLKFLKLVDKELGTLRLTDTKFTTLQRICLVAEKITGEIKIISGTLPVLVSLHVLCKSLDGVSGIDIGSFPKLEEVGLHLYLDNDATKGVWETNAKGHRNWPSIVLIDPTAKPQ